MIEDSLIDKIKINLLGFVEVSFIIVVCLLVVSKWVLAVYGLYNLLKG